MKLSELLKDKNVVIEPIEKTLYYVRFVNGGVFRKKTSKEFIRTWYGFAIVKNGKRILEVFDRYFDTGTNNCMYDSSLIINGQKQSTDINVVHSICCDLENLYKEQEQKRKEKQSAMLEQQKQVYYQMLQENLLQK